MTIEKYKSTWVGIDCGREGLWKEPLWTDVLKLISLHLNEDVYDFESPIYLELERSYPKVAWRCKEATGNFRPLFRDYPNSWTRSGVVTLSGKKFGITSSGLAVLTGAITKSAALVDMFKAHVENQVNSKGNERPFGILASAFLETPRPLNTDEIYWGVMKNYRPNADNLAEVIKRKLPLITIKPDATPRRRLRNMLTLMRSAGTLESTRRKGEIFWSALDRDLLKSISEEL